MILYNAPSSYYSMIARYALFEAGLSFENRRMDIHLAKEQLSPWYRAINPKMTVPSLVKDMRRAHKGLYGWMRMRKLVCTCSKLSKHIIV